MTAPGAVRIERIAAGGDGVGHLEDGRVVFIPRTAPGDLVEPARLRSYARYARARVGRLLEPGPGRVEPRCAHYLADDCGGCQLQHLGPEAQLAAKRAIVEDALRRIGKLDIAVPPVVPASQPWAYRSRVALAPGPGRRFAGFHPVEDAARVFGLERCEIAARALGQAWDAVRPHLHFLPRHTAQLLLREDRTGGRHLVVRTRGEEGWGRAPRLAAALVPHGVTLWWEPERGAARVIGSGGDPFPATVFEQVNPAMGDLVRQFALERLGAVGGRHVWDLYAGIGEATDRLADHGATVESVELDPRAVRLAAGGGPGADGSQGPPPARPGVTRYTGKAEDLVATLRPPALVLANPPRAGLHAAVRSAIRSHGPGRMVYVSCDPATLARDLADLCAPGEGAGLRVLEVQPFDLFPQTAHVETVAVLERPA